MTQASGISYALNVDSQTGNDVSGRIAGVITEQFSSNVGCSFTMSGTTMDAIYHNDSFQWEVPGTGQDLTLSNVNVAGCQDLLHDGDPVSFSGSYDVDQPVTITESP